MTRPAALAATVAVLAVLVAPSVAHGATRECDGLQICVPVAGPWVLVPGVTRTPTSVQFELACPRGYIVGGLDAELSDRLLEISFAGALGSPVNPGITTSRSAVFTATYVGLDRSARPSFRPHLGCIPTSGGGGRTPTAVVRTYPPGHPTTRYVRNVRLLPGSGRLRQGCGAGARLISASHAVGLFTKAPPTATQASAVRSRLVAGATAATVTVTANAVVRAVPALLQIAVDCSGGR